MVVSSGFAVFSFVGLIQISILNKIGEILNRPSFCQSTVKSAAIAAVEFDEGCIHYLSPVFPTNVTNSKNELLPFLRSMKNTACIFPPSAGLQIKFCNLYH